MNREIIVTATGASLESTGAGGWTTLVQIPRRNPIRVSGRNPATSWEEMSLTALVHGLRHLMELVDTKGTPLLVQTSSRFIARVFTGYGNPDGAGGENGKRGLWAEFSDLTDHEDISTTIQDLWDELIELVEGQSIEVTYLRADPGNPAMQVCIERASLESRMAANHPGMGPAESRTEMIMDEDLDEPVRRSLLETPQGLDPEFARGYRSGYEAARVDMANRLNEIVPEPLTVRVDDQRS